MKINDAYPSKAQFNKEDKISILVEVQDIDSDAELKCTIYRLHEVAALQERTLLIGQEKAALEFHNLSCGRCMSGYGAVVELYHKKQLVQTVSTAFDIVNKWSDAPRYGFLSDFSPEDLNDKEDLKEMNKFHLNVVQYYDWMYRHHDLLPSSDIFIDPLNRQLSLSTVKNKINEAHKYGMKALAYGAVYGAGPEFYEKNKQWALYKNDGRPMGFGNFLYIMDINKESPWYGHIIKELLKAVEFGFDGIHLDQYGDPKEAVSKVSGTDTVRNLREDFPKLIDGVRDYIEGSGHPVDLIFNAVNNWPVETVARASEDAVYIEVWPPNDTYQDLYNLIANAKRLSPDKQVILAAYMRPFLKELNIPNYQAENSTLLTMASIFVSGGFHLLLGENAGILTDAYYPKYRTVENADFKRVLRNYYDFTVRYEELLYDFDLIDTTMVNTGGINQEYTMSGIRVSPKAEADCVWSVIKEKPGYKIINLVNFTGIKDTKWNDGKENAPQEVKNIEITILTCHEIKAAFAASPDFGEGMPKRLEIRRIESERGLLINFTVPVLKVWDMIYLVY